MFHRHRRRGICCEKWGHYGLPVEEVAQAQAKAAELAAMAMRAGASGGGGGGGDAGGTTGGGGSAAGPNAAPLKVEFRKFDASQQTFVPPGETQNTSSNRF